VDKKWTSPCGHVSSNNIAFRAWNIGRCMRPRSRLILPSQSSIPGILVMFHSLTSPWPICPVSNKHLYMVSTLHTSESYSDSSKCPFERDACHADVNLRLNSRIKILVSYA